MASLQQNTVFQYWHENPGEEIYAQHTPNINSSASTGPSAPPSRNTPWSHRAPHQPQNQLTVPLQWTCRHTQRQAGKKNPTTPTMTKQVIIFHLITKYFTDGAAITCGEQEQSILLTENSMNRSAWAGWELPFLRTHHLLQHHLQHHFNYVSVLQGWQLSQCTGEEMRHFWGSTALINTPDACLVREKLRHLAVLTWSLCETMARNML